MSLNLIKFKKIVAYAKKLNPFYRYWIRDIKNPPILNRKTFLKNNDEILNGHEVTGRTSGSTGMPVCIAHSEARMKMNQLEGDGFINMHGGPLLCMNIVYLGDKKPESDFLDVHLPVREQLATLIAAYYKLNFHAISTYPTNAVALAEQALKEDVMLKYKRVILTGESVDDYQIEIIQKSFPDAQIISSYSSMEFGTIAYQCPYDSDFHHIQDKKLGIEILDDRGNLCEVGQVGKLIITDYYNTFSPFIRYEIGDLAEWGDCSCGKITAPAFRHIHGKVRGALLHRNGQRVLFADLSVMLRDLNEMRQYQVIQHEVEKFTVRLVAPKNLEEKINNCFEKHFSYLPQIEFEYLNEIPRHPNGKYYASICEV